MVTLYCFLTLGVCVCVFSVWSDGGSTVHRPQPLPPSSMHQGGLSAADAGSAYGLSSNRHSFSGYSDGFMTTAGSTNHMTPVSNGLSPQVCVCVCVCVYMWFLLYCVVPG